VIIVRSTRVVLPDGVRAASIHIQDGTITNIAGYDEVAGRTEVTHDVGNLVVSPGLVDTHVHMNEPGRTDWEGFDTGTRAAAAGGVTTIVDMPLNSVPATTTVGALEAKRTAARGHCHIDVAFWGGVVPGNAPEIDALIDAGVRGFKCFLVPSGVDEFPHVGESDLREAMPILARQGVPLLVHAESPDVLKGCSPPEASRVEPRLYQTWLATRPPEAEAEAIRLMARLAREFQARVHIVHVAAAEAVAEIARAQEDGVAMTAETCPHYLSFAAGEIPAGATEFKCAPPIREAPHREALWNALYRGVLGAVVTDHSPAPPALKCPGDFPAAWGGIASLELSLAATWTAAGSHARHHPPFHSIERPLLLRVATWMSMVPAALAGLSRKGRIAPGCDADVVVWDPDDTQIIDAPALQQRHKLTPYAGRCLRGVVHATFLRGQRIWDGRQLTIPGTGQLL
jgi:allantoinase